jgi:hypothetical protein
MALINCPECKKEVSNSAKNCPHCGFQLIREIVQKPKKKSGCATLFILGIILLGIFYFIGSGDNSETNPTKLLAYSYAEDFVEQKLKSPSTAEFPSGSEKSSHIKDLGKGEYKITSWVDSQNGFGAIVRSKYTCLIIFTDDKVRCEDLKIE